MTTEQRQPIDTSRSLLGKVAWVTGGASGIGYAVVRRLRSMGAQIAILDLRRPEGLPENEEVHICDVTSRESIEVVAARLGHTPGMPDILVTCAGAAIAAPIADHDPAQWDRMLAVNLTGTFNLVRKVFSTMAARRWGRIVLVGSDAVFMSLASLGAYSASKAGVLALGRSVATEGAQLGITCNMLSPGVVDTPMTRAHFGSREALEIAVTKEVTVNKMGVVLDPDDLASAAAFLCHPDNRHITGQTLHVNGGGVML
jgi:NAD(P)-dependent dehydrogenase (short-subunit alcohol dehydrogenase family)